MSTAASTIITSRGAWRDAEMEDRLCALLQEADEIVGLLHATRWNMALSAAIHQARCIIELRKLKKETDHA